MSRRYNRILVATDGSGRSRAAVRVAVRLAREARARLFAVNVVLERVPTLLDAGLYASPALSLELRRLLQRQADQALEGVQREAKRQHVACEGHCVAGRHVWQSILGVARRHGCDLIVMGSHGRDSAAAALLGSETLQVLARSKIPVLVCR